MVRSLCVLLAILGVSALGAPAAGSQVLPMMPLPAHTTPGTGELPVTGSFSVALTGYKDARLERAKARFLETISRKTGMFLTNPASAPTLTVTTTAAGAAVQQLGEDESYRLEVTPQAATLTAPTPLGTMHGLQTFLQLVRMTPKGFAVASVTIDDQPRFPWRGLMLDVGRHFMPMPVVLETLDAMEVVKLNVFHWHLSEDQGFRVESKRYPLLTEKGSDGLFYTQQQVREVVAYARDRGIRVVPEFDTPAHTQAWFPGYPELAAAPGPYEIARTWGVLDPVMDPTKESTYVFLDVLIREMAELFPDAYFHIGGDECNGKQWDANPAIQKYMKDHGLKDNAALQAYFTKRVQQLVAKHGKIAEGWDEVLQPDTPKDVVIQSWRGKESLAEAARRGYRGVLSAGFYIDLNQSAEQHYLADPIDAAAGLTPEQQARVLGGEATMWSEYVSPENVNSRIWPRTAAIAERLWSPADVRDVDSMYARLPGILDQLHWVGVDNAALEQRMLERIAGGNDDAPLRVLADVVQPPEGYLRGQLRAYTSATPLNHLVDAVPPESTAGREFSRLIDRIVADHIVAHSATAEEMAHARGWLTLWRGNDARLEPLTARSELAAELAPVSAMLSKVAAIGLEALDHMDNRQPLSADRVQQMQATLKQAAFPTAALVNTAVAPVGRLVQAAAK
jgi:hexosaminidase